MFAYISRIFAASQNISTSVADKNKTADNELLTVKGQYSSKVFKNDRYYNGTFFPKTMKVDFITQF